MFCYMNGSYMGYPQLAPVETNLYTHYNNFSSIIIWPFCNLSEQNMNINLPNNLTFSVAWKICRMSEVAPEFQFKMNGKYNNKFYILRSQNDVLSMPKNL